MCLSHGILGRRPPCLGAGLAANGVLTYAARFLTRT